MSKKNTRSESMLDEALVQDSKVENTQNVERGKEVSLSEYHKTSPFSFSKQNYRLLFIGLAVNILGFILMIGGATSDPAKFDGDALFSPVRITLAPMLIVAGYVVIMFAIMKKPKAE